MDIENVTIRDLIQYCSPKKLTDKEIVLLGNDPKINDNCLFCGKDDCVCEE